MKFLDKKKVRDAFTIADIVKEYSSRFEVRGKAIFFLCPFHDDQKLGSCWAYLDAHTFTCSSCREKADVLKLASAYTGISLKQMNDLLEELVNQFGLPRERYLKDADSFPGDFARIDSEELLEETEYQRLVGCSVLRKPADKKKVLINGSKKEVTTRYDYLTFTTLARRNKRAYDNEIITRSRVVWRKLNALRDKCARDKQFCYYCESLFCKGGLVTYSDNAAELIVGVEQLRNRARAYEVFDALIRENESLLKKALIDKSLFDSEIALRKEIRARERLKNDIIGRLFEKKEGCI